MGRLVDTHAVSTKKKLTFGTNSIWIVSGLNDNFHFFVWLTRVCSPTTSSFLESCETGRTKFFRRTIPFKIVNECLTFKKIRIWFCLQLFKCYWECRTIFCNIVQYNKHYLCSHRGLGSSAVGKSRWHIYLPLTNTQ